MGANPFGQALTALVGKRIHSRPIRIVEFDDPVDFVPCQILLCDTESFTRFGADYQELLDQHNVLSIGEGEVFTLGGGVMSMIVVDDHLGFEINDVASRRAHIELSASLYKLAQNVIE